MEILASGCLATTFVWLQHRGGLREAATSTRPGIRERWHRPLATGQRRAGIAPPVVLLGGGLLLNCLISSRFVTDIKAQEDRQNEHDSEEKPECPGRHEEARAPIREKFAAREGGASGL